MIKLYNRANKIGSVSVDSQPMDTNNYANAAEATDAATPICDVNLTSFKSMTTNSSGQMEEDEHQLNHRNKRGAADHTQFNLSMVDSFHQSLAPALDRKNSSSSEMDHSTSILFPSVSDSALPLAVECRKLRYDVSPGIPEFIKGNRQKRTILRNINVTIPEGSIYGLLGPSGCGKTTMLRCVIGRIQPASGRVRVFGHVPNEPGSEVPGPVIGYMPQEVSLYEDFTINETLTYFGRINKMEEKLIKCRVDFLLKILDLPEKNRLIANLSVGQQRRVSLASALIHSPPLLILDEPTVGVDPLLRQAIWRHLVTLAQTERTTIIITTHYIEEARQASVVGLMRHGKLLAEDSPDNLMEKHGLSSLEDVFLKLCISDSSAVNHGAAGLMLMKGGGDDNVVKSLASLDAAGGAVSLAVNNGKKTATSKHPLSRLIMENVSAIPAIEASSSPEEDNHLKQNNLSLLAGTAGAGGKRAKRYEDDFTSGIIVWLKCLLAVTWKNYIRLKRNPPLLFFCFVTPPIQVMLFFLCIGADPYDVPLAVVNEELIPISSRFLLDSINKDAVRQVPYTNLTEAIESVRHGENWAVLHIPYRFTQNLQARLLNPYEVTKETLYNGSVHIYPDLSNLLLASVMENTFREAFIGFAKTTLNTLGYDEEAADLPIKIETPIYGSLDRSGFIEFMAPGMIISITYTLASALTTLAFILEKRDGLLERSLVSGVTNSQLLWGHACLQCTVMLWQVASVCGVTFFFFKIPSHGPFAWAMLLIFLQGCAGMCFGLLVSAICNEENTAIMMLAATFYTNLILAGIVWPTEAMPFYLRWFSYVQPQTLPTQALRNVLSRGWGIELPGVYGGFLVTIAYLIVFLLAAGTFMRHSK